MKEKKKSRRDPTSTLEAPEPSRVVNTEGVQLNVDAQSSGEDDHAAPFILVDCAQYTCRSDLVAILSQVEKERMEKVQADIENNYFSMLEDMEPPPELDMPINLSSQALAKLKDAEDERRFKEDLQSLRIAGVEGQELDTSISLGNTTNPQFKSLSDMTIEDGQLLLRTMASMEPMRCKLEQLKNVHEKSGSAESAPQVKGTTLIPLPGLRRQGTFEIKRKKVQQLGHPEVSTNPAVGQKEKFPSACRGGESEKVISEADRIFSQIGDLLVKLQLQHEGSKVLDKGSSYAYMVTIKPDGGASNCSVYAITKLKSHEVKEDLKSSHTPLINILSPGDGVLKEASQLSTNTQYIDGSSIGLMPLHETPTSRIKPPILRKRSCSYMRVSNPARFCHGRKKN
ncbi:uncharacterized protein LOC122620588 [Drosophila teissieri]|uniref:uncharacterized protein LOC122620588 n=1 Tax=Drosophila teissieri TaxID=7243 RepID=UPI001CBA1106|nr:uncharacterized protein LOC122620588 [Drosophila teissieri]XP_043654058.1 uncharacterized protein LOC122620588 [Drosophila teissieri]